MRYQTTNKEEKMIKITRAGYIYRKGKKISEKRLTPLQIPAGMSKAEEKQALKWINRNYTMAQS